MLLSGFCDVLSTNRVLCDCPLCSKESSNGSRPSLSSELQETDLGADSMGATQDLLGQGIVVHARVLAAHAQQRLVQPRKQSRRCPVCCHGLHVAQHLELVSHLLTEGSPPPSPNTHKKRGAIEQQKEMRVIPARSQPAQQSIRQAEPVDKIWHDVLAC